MDDLISRQAAIDALRTCQTYLFVSYDDDKKISLESAEYMIEQLPSAQPEIIRCRDCMYWQTDDGTFPDFDGRPWHECKCLYMFRTPDGEPARTTADFWCGYGERREDNGTET